MLYCLMQQEAVQAKKKHLAVQEVLMRALFL
jgi:hypothetical protein